MGNDLMREKIERYRSKIEADPGAKWVDFYLSNIVVIEELLPGWMSRCRIVKPKLGNGHFAGDIIFTPTDTLREATEEDWILVEKAPSRSAKKARKKLLEDSDPHHDPPEDEEEEETPSSDDAEEEIIELIDT